MCQSPISVVPRETGREVVTSCGKCWQCRDNRVRDLVGRCIAEDRHSVASSVVTLTYGTDRSTGVSKTLTLSAAVLTYSDVQGYFKRLRNNGYTFRYVVCGEKGSLKGRCHWHIIFFWQSAPPQHHLGVRFLGHEEWTGHPDSAGGHTYWDTFSYESARYVCKYLLKNDSDDESQGFVRWSKGRKGSGGLLGSEFFRQLAGLHVRHQLPISGRRYSFAEVRDPRTGAPRQFYMNDATLDYFCAEYVAQWLAAYGEHPEARMHSDTLGAYFDRIAKRMQVEDFEHRARARAPQSPPVDLETGEVWPTYFDRGLNTFVAFLGAERQYWCRDEWGNWSWQEGIAPSSTPASTLVTAHGAVSQRLRSQERFKAESVSIGASNPVNPSSRAF